jgi:hypothetical protein
LGLWQIHSFEVGPKKVLFSDASWASWITIDRNRFFVRQTDGQTGWFTSRDKSLVRKG